MIEELRTHGYSMSAGTLYPMLHNMEAEGLLHSEKLVVEGKQRKQYTITDSGRTMLRKCQQKLQELTRDGG